MIVILFVVLVGLCIGCAIERYCPNVLDDLFPGGEDW